MVVGETETRVKEEAKAFSLPIPHAGSAPAPPPQMQFSRGDHCQGPVTSLGTSSSIHPFVACFAVPLFVRLSSASSHTTRWSFSSLSEDQRGWFNNLYCYLNSLSWIQFLTIDNFIRSCEL